MVYLIGPDGLANRRFANFHKMVWMTTVHVHVLRFRIKHQKSPEIITVFRPLPVRRHVGALFLEEFSGAHTLILKLGMRIIHIHAVFGKFAYPQFIGYAEYIRSYQIHHLKSSPRGGSCVRKMCPKFECIFEKYIPWECQKY